MTVPHPVRLAAAVAIACLAALAIDRWCYEHVVFVGVYDQDWGRLLRSVGYWPTWAIGAFALWLHERGSIASAGQRALFVAGSPAICGIVDEVLKLLIRRERPEANAGAYVFRSFSDHPWSTAGIGSPSSHAAVAFGGAAAMSALFPKARLVWFGLAGGCAVTRVLARAHFASDVVAGAALAIVIGGWFARRLIGRARAEQVAAHP
ncbi:MAG: hypothetical protein JWM95_3411 [Gemmatimonadetes bacterium]|nr:hypothetical protein [Gemmatimonadota bacterium]